MTSSTSRATASRPARWRKSSQVTTGTSPNAPSSASADDLKGQSPLGFLCLNKWLQTAPTPRVVKECVSLMREKIGPVADFKRACVVERLPKTRSGKILRGTMAKIADGVAYKPPATIDDPAILDEIRAALQELGLART